MFVPRMRTCTVQAEMSVRSHVTKVRSVSCLRSVQLESFGASQEAAICKHVTTAGMQRPVVAFARPTGRARNFDEAVVEAEVVADGVLPALLVRFEVGEAFHDEGVDYAEHHHTGSGTLQCHGDERDVRVWRLDVSETSFLL